MVNYSALVRSLLPASLSLPASAPFRARKVHGDGRAHRALLWEGHPSGAPLCLSSRSSTPFAARVPWVLSAAEVVYVGIL